jgi:electron transfer flavoprotein beta subunit
VDPAWTDRDPLDNRARFLKGKMRRARRRTSSCSGASRPTATNAAVGPMLATLLGWACVTDVIGLEIADGRGTARREADAGLETFSFALPAVITCQKDLNEPRYAGLKGIMAAKKKPVEEAPAPANTSQVEVVKLELPASRKAGRIVGEGAAAVPALIDALRNEAKLL